MSTEVAPEALAAGGAPTERSEGGGAAAALDPVEKSYADDVDRVLAAAGVSLPCSQPIMVVDQDTGETMQVRCGTRRKSACPSCAALYAGDAKHLIRSGVIDVDPGSVVVMLTLTAPSFGRVHRVPKVAASPRLSLSAQTAWARRAVRSRCACGQQHAPGDPVAGTALDAEAYDFTGQAAWNATTGRLWNRTATRLGRALGLDERLQYGGTAEMQSRGAVHFHLLIRLPTSVLGSLGVQHDSSGRLRAREIERQVRATRTTVDGTDFAWGAQVVAEVVAGPGIDGERHARRTIGYIVKAVAYTVKDLSDEHDSYSPHHARAHHAARRMDCPACRRAGRATPRGCRSPRHRSFGYAGWPVRRSRDFTPLTFGALRQARCTWNADRNGHVDREETSRSWRFVAQDRNSQIDDLRAGLKRTCDADHSQILTRND